MIKIYHNPRCSKSRQCIALLETSDKKFVAVKYIDTPLSEETLRELLSLLRIEPINLVRKNEPIWKEHFKGKNLTNDEIISAMLQHPKLMERPIVVNGKKAIIGRPPERVFEIL